MMNKKLPDKPRKFLLVTITADNNISNIYELIKRFIETNNIIPNLIEYVIEKTKNNIEHTHIAICTSGINPAMFERYLDDKIKTFFDISVHRSANTLVSYINKEIPSKNLYTDNSINVNEAIDQAYIHKKRVQALFREEDDRLNSLLVQNNTSNKNILFFDIIRDIENPKSLINNRDPLITNFRMKYGSNRLFLEWCAERAAYGKKVVDPYIIFKDYHDKNPDLPYTEEDTGKQRMGMLKAFAKAFDHRRNSMVKNPFIFGDSRTGKTSFVTEINKIEKLIIDHVSVSNSGFATKSNPYAHMWIWNDAPQINDVFLEFLKNITDDNCRVNTKGGEIPLIERMPLAIFSNHMNPIDNKIYGSNYDALQNRYDFQQILKAKEPDINWLNFGWNVRRIVATFINLLYPQILKKLQIYSGNY